MCSRWAVGSWRWATRGWWWLAAVGGWGLVVDGGWQWLAVGGWSPLAVGGGWRLAVGGGWWLAVDGPLGRSLTAVLNKKKFSPLNPPPLLSFEGCCGYFVFVRSFMQHRVQLELPFLESNLWPVFFWLIVACTMSRDELPTNCFLFLVENFFHFVFPCTTMSPLAPCTHFSKRKHCASRFAVVCPFSTCKLR